MPLTAILIEEKCPGQLNNNNYFWPKCCLVELHYFTFSGEKRPSLKYQGVKSVDVANR